MMGAVANAAMDAGGEVIGVMPEIFNTPQLALATTTGFEITPDIHARIARMMELEHRLLGATQLRCRNQRVTGAGDRCTA